MEYRRLGTTALRVSSLSLGTMVFGEEGSRGTDKGDAKRIIEAYIDAGGNFIDTADVYAGGKSEKIVGDAIDDRRDDVVLATKLRFPMGKGPNDKGLSRKYIYRAVHASLERLDTDYIDLLYLHARYPNMNWRETLQTLGDIVSEGKIHYIGVSNFRAYEVMKALALSDQWDYPRFQAIQLQHSLVERNVEFEHQPLSLEEGLSMVPWSPLGGGFLTGKYHSGDKPAEGRISVMPDHAEESWTHRATEKNWKTLEVVERVAQNHEASIPQVALAWLMTQPAVVSPIIGVRTMDQFTENIGAESVKLNPDQVEELSLVSSPEVRYPYRFIQNYASE